MPVSSLTLESPGLLAGGRGKGGKNMKTNQITYSGCLLEAIKLCLFLVAGFGMVVLIHCLVWGK